LVYKPPTKLTDEKYNGVHTTRAYRKNPWTSLPLQDLIFEKLNFYLPINSFVTYFESKKNIYF
jgi:hypothetical protein